MQRLARFALVAALAAPVPALAQSAAVQGGPTLPRLGSFSPHRAFSDSAEGKAAIKKLAALQEKKAGEIAAKNKALQTQEQALEGTMADLVDEVRIQRQRDLEKFRIDVQRFIQDAQAEVAGVQREIETGFLSRLKPAVEYVAKAKGLQMVVNLDDGMVVWADPALDITKEVVERLAKADTPREP